MNKISPGCEGCDLKNDVVMSFLKGSVRFCKREKEKKMSLKWILEWNASS
jgi:hypothetical protein